MRNLTFLSLLLALPLSTQANLSQEQKYSHVENGQFNEMLAEGRQGQKNSELANNYIHAIIEYGPASPEVCVEIARGYAMALEAGTSDINYFLDMMVARCSIYYQGGEKEEELERLLEADRRVMEMHRRLTEMRLD